MAGNLQPLDEKFAIVDENGKPTLYFIKWAQQRQIDITASITSAQFDELLLAYLAAHLLQEGDGIALTPSGNLNDSPSISVRNGTGLDFDGMQNLKIADTAVTPGTYGSATHVGQFTVDQQGRITAAADVAISGAGGGGILWARNSAPPSGLTSTVAFATLGNKFQALRACSVSQVWAQFTPVNTATYIMGLYEVGADLTIDAVNVTASRTTLGTVNGWFGFDFASAVALAANTGYILALTRTDGATNYVLPINTSGSNGLMTGLPIIVQANTMRMADVAPAVADTFTDSGGAGSYLLGLVGTFS